MNSNCLILYSAYNTDFDKCPFPAADNITSRLILIMSYSASTTKTIHVYIYSDTIYTNISFTVVVNNY